MKILNERNSTHNLIQDYRLYLAMDNSWIPLIKLGQTVQVDATCKIH